MSEDKVVASIEARMGSSRLPGKVLADVCGKPALTRLLQRLQRSKRLDEIVLATSTASADDELEAWAIGAGVPCYRGSEEDVLNRVTEAHRMMQSDVIVEVTGDCTLIDPEVIDQAIDLYDANDCQVVANVDPVTYPMGVDVQVFPFELLAEVEATITDPIVREHVSIYFYRNPDRYRLLRMIAPQSLRRPELRFQLDYPEDLAFIREVYQHFLDQRCDTFTTRDVLDLLAREPALAKINAHCEETVLP